MFSRGSVDTAPATAAAPATEAPATDQPEGTSTPAPEPAAPSREPSVEVRDGVYCLVLETGSAIPFHQWDVPLTSVGAGWRFHALHTLFAPLLLMELEHDSGQRATWYFDSSPRYVANAVADLDPFYRAALFRRMAEVMDAVLSSRPHAHGDRLADAFFRIGALTRIEIALAFVAASCPPPRILPAADLAHPRPVLLERGADGAVAIRPDRVRSAAAVDFQDRLKAAVQDGQLTWPSLMDGRPLPCLAGLCLTDFMFAYRFEEPGSRLPFYVVTSLHKASCLGIFLPTENLVIAPGKDTELLLGRFTSNIVGSIAHFIATYGATFRAYLRRPGPKALAASVRELHLGHQVWNELSGLETLADATPSARLPMLLQFGGDRMDVFGPLDLVFPEFVGKTRPSLRTHLELVDFAHAEGLVLARFTQEFVPATLRDRLLRVVRKTDEYWAAANRRKASPGAVVLIGLRVENRTAADLPGFVTMLVRCIAEELPGVLIVLDGQNGGPSFAGEQAIRSPVEAELELCRQVQAAFDPKQVAIEIASGRSVATSIAWSHFADAFVAFWGAGLAKYRWIANKPGLVISNRDNLTQRSDLHIYDDAAFMADPAPLAFVDPAVVTDDPGAPQLIPIPDPSFANFHVDEAAFLDAVRRFLAPWKVPAAAAPSQSQVA